MAPVAANPWVRPRFVDDEGSLFFGFKAICLEYG